MFLLNVMLFLKVLRVMEFLNILLVASIMPSGDNRILKMILNCDFLSNGVFNCTVITTVFYSFFQSAHCVTNISLLGTATPL